jgi:hypothetical protein
VSSQPRKPAAKKAAAPKRQTQLDFAPATGRQSKRPAAAKAKKNLTVSFCIAHAFSMLSLAQFVDDSD